MADSQSKDPKLHDAMLEKLSLDWGAGQVELLIRAATGVVILRASGVTNVVCPRLQPWGRSSSVDEVRGPLAKDGRSVLEIEMQSGDVIVIEAASFAVERR